MHIYRLDARNDGCEEKTARAGGRTHTQRTWSASALEDAEELLLLLRLARDADLRRAAAARPVHARDLGRRQGPGVAPHLLVVREAVLLRARREVVAALGAAAPVEGLAEDADVGLGVEVGLVLVRHLLDVGLAVVEGRHAEARLHPALLALEVRVVPGAAALHVGDVFQGDLALAHVLGVDGVEVVGLALLERRDEGVEGAGLEAARAAGAEVRLRLLLLGLDLLPLLGRHAARHVGLQLRRYARRGRGGLEGAGRREGEGDDDGLHGVFFAGSNP